MSANAMNRNHAVDVVSLMHQRWDSASGILNGSTNVSFAGFVENFEPHVVICDLSGLRFGLEFDSLRTSSMC